MILELHHIQLAMPEDREEEARAFYGGVLGLREVDKPEELRARCGVWFESGSVKVHLGVETPFSPARKAHPAFRVENLEQTIATLRLNGLAARPDVDLPGIRRIYVDDPFGNRIELLELT